MRFIRIAVVFALLLVMAAPGFCQFTFEKAKRKFLYQETRPVELYSHSHFNRIEGVYLDLGVRLNPPRAPGWSVFGNGGYGFDNDPKKRWRYTLGVEKDFATVPGLILGGKYFDELFTQDKWIIHPYENSLYALVAHTDYMDYVGRKGGIFYADYKLQQLHTLRLEVASYRYDVLSVQPKTDFSIFGRNKDYALNPPFYPDYPFKGGNETSLRLMAALDFQDNPIFPIIGWYFEGIFEKTFRDFETTSLFLTVKRFQPTFGNQRLLAKLLLGTRSGSFAYQHLMTLGGLGSMRGFNNKEFIGNRLLYGTVQYNFGGDILQRIPLQFIPFWETVSIGAFWDFGYAWFADPQNPDADLFAVGDFSLGDIRSDVGFSFMFSEGLLHLDVARRMDISNPRWRVLLRILHKF